MSLETRNGRTYYYTAKRVDGRVVKSYKAAGELATLSARLDTLRRETEQAEATDVKIALYFLTVGCNRLWDAADQVSRLASFFIEAAGYHRHDRGRWRKKRMVNFVDGTKQQEAEIKAVSQIPATKKERAALVLKAMNSKDKNLITLAVATLKLYPDELNSSFLSEVDGAVKRLTTNEIGRQMFQNEASQMRKNLYEDREPSKIPYAERLMIERVIACQFAVNYIEQKTGDSMSLKVGEYWQRALDRAHKRYLSSLKTLAEIKRLSLPSVSVALPGSTQVNIGEKQVNVSMGGGSALSPERTADSPLLPIE